MRIRLIDGAIATTPGMLAFVERHVATALGRFAPGLREIRVRITDVNGPKGGVDKRCVILATPKGRSSGVMIARYADTTFYGAIAGAAHSLKPVVARRMARSHACRTSAGRHPQARPG